MQENVDGERFAGLNIRSSAPSKFSRKYFHIVLAISAHYLVQFKRGAYNHGKPFTVLLTTVKNAKI